MKNMTMACTIEPLTTEKRKYFHPSRWLWEKVPDRKSAWRIKPSYYLRLPANEVAFPIADFQKHFTLIVSIRADPKIRTEGTIFSLSSRSQPNTFLSLNLDGPNILRIVQSSPNKTQSVAIPAAVADGHWHQLALGIQDNVSVRSYLDCRWISTDILRNNSLADTAEDADLLIGYLFSGDLEHLILVPDSGAVVQQCSTNVISVLDPDISDKQPHTTLSSTKYHGRSHSSVLRNKESSLFKDTTNSENELVAIGDDEDAYPNEDGSGSTSIFKIAWSSWTECSVTCGIGIQRRQLQCTQFSEYDEPCSLPRPERVETRTCNVRPCSTSEKNIRLRKRKYPTLKYEADDILDNGINLTQRKYEVLKNHRMREEIYTLNCEAGEMRPPIITCDCVDGSKYECNNNSLCCRCLNGGGCWRNTCKCLPGWTGVDCSIAICKPYCRNKGYCIKPNECLCQPGTTGHYCEENTCGSGCLNDGVCVGYSICKCPPKVTGLMCESVLCDPPCENGATCTRNNECLCTPSMKSARCTKKKCHYKAVRKPLIVGFRRLARKRYSFHCKQNTADCASRLVPKFRTTYKTVYRTVYQCIGNEINVHS